MLEVADNISTIDTSLVLGDMTGFLHVQTDNKFYIEYSETNDIR